MVLLDGFEDFNRGLRGVNFAGGVREHLLLANEFPAATSSNCSGVTVIISPDLQHLHIFVAAHGVIFVSLRQLLFLEPGGVTRIS